MRRWFQRQAEAAARRRALDLDAAFACYRCQRTGLLGESIGLARRDNVPAFLARQGNLPPQIEQEAGQGPAAGKQAPDWPTPVQGRSWRLAGG